MNTTTAQVAVTDEQTKKYLTLLELSKAIASHRNLPELFHDVACRLQNLFDFSHLGVLLYDPSRIIYDCIFWKPVIPPNGKRQLRSR